MLQTLFAINCILGYIKDVYPPLYIFFRKRKTNKIIIQKNKGAIEVFLFFWLK